MPLPILNNEAHNCLLEKERHLDSLLGLFPRKHPLPRVVDCLLRSNVVEREILIVLKNPVAQGLDDARELGVAEDNFLEAFLSNDVDAALRGAAPANL